MILRTRTSTVVRNGDKVLGFNAVDPFSGRHYVFLPGGAIEPNESPVTCAERETFEETGYKVKAEPSSLMLREYPFFWNGAWYLSRTYFYRAKLLSEKGETVVDADYNKGPVWIPIAEAAAVFGYSDDIRETVLALI